MNRFCLLALLVLTPLVAHADDPIANASFADGLKGWETWLEAAEAKPPVTVDHAVFRGADMASLAMKAETGRRGLLLQTALPRDPQVSKYRFTLWVKCRNLGPDWIIRAALMAAKDKTVIKWLQNSHFTQRGRTMDWTPWSLEAVVPPEATHLAICLGLWTDDKLKANPPEGGGTVWFDDLALSPVGAPTAPTAAPAPAPTGLQLERLFPIGERGLFQPGQPLQLMLSGQCTAPTPVEYGLQVRLVDFFGQPAGAKSFHVRAEPGKPVRETLDLPAADRLGWLRVETTCTHDGKAAVGPQTSLCVVQPVERRDDYFAADVNGQEAELVPAMRTIGVSARKIGGTIRWVPMDQRGDLVKYWQNEITTGRTAVYWKSDLTLIGNIFIGGEFMDPQWKATIEERRQQGLFPYPDAFFQQFGDFVEAEATVFKPRVKVWVLSEEIDGTVGVPDLLSGSPSAEVMRYVLMCRIAYQRLKQVNPENQVIGLAVSSDFNQTPSYPMVRRLLADLRDYTDVIGPDLYTDSWNWVVQPSRGPEAGEMRSKLLDTLALQASLHKATVTTISERGYGLALHLPPTDPLEKLQADLTARSLIIGKSLPQVQFYALHMFCGSGGWWESTGKVSTDANPQIDLGLWRSWYEKGGKVWYRPRSAVAAYATVARMLGGSTACTEVLPEQGIYSYVFTCPDRTVAALWTTDAQSCAMQLDLPAEVECVDLMGNARKLAKGPAQVALSSSPVFLRVAAPPEVIAEMLRKATFPARSSLKAEARLADLNTAVVDLVNQSAQPVSVEVRVTKVAGAVAATPTLRGEVPGSGKQSLRVPLQQVQLARLGELQATIHAGAQALPVVADLSARAVPAVGGAVKVDGDLAEWAKLPPLALDSADALMPSREVMARGLWTGPDDLSVTAWLGWDERALYVAARVRDDAHVQRQSGDKMWMDDCFQFALDMVNDALSPAVAGRSGYDANDYNFGAGLTGDSPSLYCFVERGATEPQGPRSYPVAVRRVRGETVYELALPWEALRVQPRPGLVFALSFVVFDVDTPEERQASYWMGLTPGIAGGQDPSQYRTFVLTR
ncbi:hypothetical protein LLH23_12135 [bacterium]|nr:hypothetical protein [bacterium]